MVKALFLGLLASTICGFVCAAPLASAILPNTTSPLNKTHHHPEAPLEDPAARIERSTNFSHVTGAARKIQMFIKNRHLQLLPDGIVNGTTDDTSAYTILQRTSVGIGKMKIQGVATCQYLCMDGCGLLYGSREFGDECIFKETIEQHHYNTYSSIKYSNDRRTMYLALNRKGQSRKVILKVHQQLGKLSSYTRVLTRTVAPERAEELQLPPMRHHGHICSNVVTHKTHQPLQSHDPPRCRKRRKRKKKKRKCPETDPNFELCQKRQSVASRAQNKCDDESPDSRDSECQRDVTVKKKHKIVNMNSEKALVSVQKKKKKTRKGVRKRMDDETTSTEATTTLLPVTSTTLSDDTTPDEDYGIESSTHSDWEDSTALPDISMAVSDGKIAAQPHSDSD